jgi:NAD(P)-dependent dehydrogenase (short-subunit alcohol dehydrogenase family)
MAATIDASEILRPGLLEGVSVLIAGAAPVTPGAPEDMAESAGDSLARAVGSACAGLGAQVVAWDPVDTPPALDLLVFDGAGAFGRAGAQDEQPLKRTPRDALSACLDAAWEVTHAIVNGAFLPAERPGRIVYLAPAPDAGTHAEPARAGLENLARTLSIEWARHGITTATIAPGAKTSSGEVAALVAYLASPAGPYFSGCLLDLRAPTER